MAKQRPGHQFYSNGLGSESGYDQLQSDNDQMIDGLRNKVGALKSLTLDMGDEIKDQNKFIKEMDNTFDSTWGFLSSSVNRVKRIANSGQNRHILYLILFAFFVFFIIYVIMKLR